MPRKTFRQWHEALLAKEQAIRDRRNKRRRETYSKNKRDRENETEQQRVRRRKDGIKPRRPPRPPMGTDEYRDFMREYMRDYRRKHKRKDKRKDPDAYRKYAREHERDKRGVGYITIIEKAAAKLGMTTRELRTQLLTIIVNNGLIDAILNYRRRR